MLRIVDDGIERVERLRMRDHSALRKLEPLSKKPESLL